MSGFPTREPPKEGMMIGLSEELNDSNEKARGRVGAIA